MKTVMGTAISRTDSLVGVAFVVLAAVGAKDLSADVVELLLVLA
jgi:hypothetical protein